MWRNRHICTKFQENRHIFGSTKNKNLKTWQRHIEPGMWRNLTKMWRHIISSPSLTQTQVQVLGKFRLGTTFICIRIYTNKRWIEQNTHGKEQIILNCNKFNVWFWHLIDYVWITITSYLDSSHVSMEFQCIHTYMSWSLLIFLVWRTKVSIRTGRRWMYEQKVYTHDTNTCKQANR